MSSLCSDWPSVAAWAECQQPVFAYWRCTNGAVLQAHEAMDALKENLREEHVIVYDYLTSFHQARHPSAGVRGKDARVLILSPHPGGADLNICMPAIFVQQGRDLTPAGWASLCNSSVLPFIGPHLHRRGGHGPALLRMLTSDQPPLRPCRRWAADAGAKRVLRSARAPAHPARRGCRLTAPCARADPDASSERALHRARVPVRARQRRACDVPGCTLRLPERARAPERQAADARNAELGVRAGALQGWGPAGLGDLGGAAHRLRVRVGWPAVDAFRLLDCVEGRVDVKGSAPDPAQYGTSQAAHPTRRQVLALQQFFLKTVGWR